MPPKMNTKDERGTLATVVANVSKSTKIYFKSYESASRSEAYLWFILFESSTDASQRLKPSVFQLSNTTLPYFSYLSSPQRPCALIAALCGPMPTQDVEKRAD